VAPLKHPRATNERQDWLVSTLTKAWPH